MTTCNFLSYICILLHTTLGDSLGSMWLVPLNTYFNKLEENSSSLLFWALEGTIMVKNWNFFEDILSSMMGDNFFLWRGGGKNIFWTWDQICINRSSSWASLLIINDSKSKLLWNLHVQYKLIRNTSRDVSQEVYSVKC